MSEKLVSVIIPYYKGREYIQNCVSELYKNTKSDIELIISSDGYDDMDFLQALADKFDLKVVFGERIGFGGNCNRAFEHTRGEFIVFLNQDVFVSENWDEPLVKALKEKHVGVVGAKLLYRNGKIQHCGVVFSPLFDTVHIYRMFPDDFSPSEREREFQTVTGALLGIRRDVFERFRFSQQYFLYYEETDLCFRVRMSGLRVLYVPQIRGVHLETSSISKKKAAELSRRSREMFLRSWKNHIVADELRTYLQDGQYLLFLKATAKYMRKLLKTKVLVPAQRG